MDDPAGTAFQRHYAQIFRYVRRRSSTDEQAEEIAQAVFADAAERLAEFQPGSAPVLAWLYTVARRRLADRGRAATRTHRTLAALAAARAEGLEEQQYGPVIASALREAIQQLPPGQRRVVVMKLLEDRPFAEIAHRVGVSEAACKMRFARGLEALRDGLRERGIGP